MALSPKHQRFVAEYLKDQNATQAAIRAGYASANADVTGPRLLGNVGIAAEVQARLGRLMKKAELRAESVIEAIRRNVDAEAYGDIRALYDEQGNIKAIHSLTRDESDKIGGFETVIKNAAAGDGHTDTVLKLKVKDHSRYVEMGAKHFKLLTDIVQVEGLEKVADRLAEARKKHAGAR